MSAAKVVASPKISQKGTYGYLLWLRSSMPHAYVKAVQSIPQVAAFEASLPRAQSPGLGDDFDVDTSAFDMSVPDVSVATDVSSDFSLSASSVDLVNDPVSFDSSSFAAPSLPEVAPPPDIIPSASSTAASIASSVLPAIAKIVTAAAPVAVAAINNSTAKVNQVTAAKVNQTAAIQYAAAVQGLAPLQTGVITPAAGSAYIAPLAALPGSLSAGLSSTVAGIPVWILALGGLGLLALVAA